MKMLKIDLILLSVCFVLFGSVQVQAATWYASSGASGSGTSASDPGDFESLVTSSAAGDSLILATGTYTVSTTGVKLDHALTITGAGMGSTVLDCAAAPSICFEMDSSTITTVNTAIQALTFQDGVDYQLEITNGSPTITNVAFTGTVTTLLGSLESKNGHPIVKNSTFSATGIRGHTAINAEDSGVPKMISGCTFSDTSLTQRGIVLDEAQSGVIQKNTFEGNYTGIGLYDGTLVTVYNNTFKNNKTGIFIYTRSGTGKNTIKANKFITNNYGIDSNAAVTSVEESTIDSNKFTGNTHALDMWGTSNTVVNNFFNDNTDTSIVSSYASLVSSYGSGIIAFNTIVNNTGDGILLGMYDEILVVNNIVFNNSGYGINIASTSTTVQLGGNNTFGNTSGTISGTYVDLGGNLDTAPKFKTGTFKPSATSPLINAAISTYTIGYDITGKVRTTPDIGAYEY